MLLGTLVMKALALAFPIFLALAACSSGEGHDSGTGTATPPGDGRHHGLTREQQGEAVVKIGDRTITAGEFADKLSDQSPFIRARYASPERRREFLDNLVRFELLAAEAHRLHYDQADDVVRSRDQMMIQQMMKDQFEDRIHIEDISDADVAAYYNAHGDEFHKPPQMRASHIFMHDRAAAQRLLAQIQAHRDDIAFFRDAAEHNDEDPATKDRFGDLGFFSRPAERQPGDPTVPDAVATAAFALANIGDVAPQLVQTPEGFHILKLTSKRDALNRTLEEASRVIRNKLWRERREQAVNEFVAHLREEGHVQIDEAALAAVHVDVPDAGPLGASSGEEQQQPAHPGAGLPPPAPLPRVLAPGERGVNPPGAVNGDEDDQQQPHESPLG